MANSDQDPSGYGSAWISPGLTSWIRIRIRIEVPVYAKHGYALSQGYCEFCSSFEVIKVKVSCLVLLLYMAPVREKMSELCERNQLNLQIKKKCASYL